jgi:hypothetical protein
MLISNKKKSKINLIVIKMVLVLICQSHLIAISLPASGDVSREIEKGIHHQRLLLRAQKVARSLFNCDLSFLLQSNGYFKLKTKNKFAAITSQPFDFDFIVHLVYFQ